LALKKAFTFVIKKEMSRRGIFLEVKCHLRSLFISLFVAKMNLIFSNIDLIDLIF
jgi:hypothetical protein